MKCSYCHKRVFPYGKTDAKVLVGTFEDAKELAHRCSSCNDIFCGGCGQENAIEIEEGAFVPACPVCLGMLRPYSG
jgi:hypothetical protein